MLSQDESEDHQAFSPPSTASTTTPLPALDQSQATWFATSTPIPGGAGSQGLPLGLLPLGGLLCTRSISTEAGPGNRIWCSLFPTHLPSTMTPSKFGGNVESI